MYNEDYSPEQIAGVLKKRPVEVAFRTNFGYWEGDTVEIICGELYLITLVERVSRFIACAFVSNKRSKTVQAAITTELKRFPGACKSMTFDKGIEFANHKTILIINTNN